MTRPDELAVLAAAPLLTGRYQSWRPEHGVPVRSTVGYPRFWRHGDLIHVQAITPYGLLQLDDATARDKYLARLDERADEAVAFLADVARQHPGQPLVLMCFEDVHAGQVCHRRWFAEWFQRRYGIEVPEIDDLPPSGGEQLTLW